MLKRTITFFTVLMTFGALTAQTHVPRITEARMTDDFYAEQMARWKAETERDRANAEAWWNYWLAARYKGFPAIHRDEAYKQVVDGIVEEMGKAIPETFEYHYIVAWHSGHSEETLPHLMEAYRLNPKHPMINEPLFTHYHMQGDWEEAEKFMRCWYDSRQMAPQFLKLSYNILQSVDERGILFTAGDNDTYPVWMLQEARGVRPDVSVLNVHLLLDSAYAERVLIRHRLRYDPAALQGLNREDPAMWENMTHFIRHLAKMNPDRPVFVTLSMQQEVFAALEQDLYLVGLTFRYSPAYIDNIALLKRNWQERLQLDYLQFDVYTERFSYDPQQLPYTQYIYLYPALTLYRHHEMAGESHLAADYLEFAKAIGGNLGDTELYRKLLAEMEGTPGG